MATVINNPGSNTEGSGAGVVVGVIVAVIVIVLFFLYALPAIRNHGTANVNVNLPNNPAQGQ